MQKSLYVADGDQAYWSELDKIARRKKLSTSKLLAEMVRNYVHADRESLKLGLPVGFRIPASMKDPRVMRAEKFADDVRERVLQEMLELLNMEVPA
jgi:hypothetical protein